MDIRNFKRSKGEKMGTEFATNGRRNDVRISSGANSSSRQFDAVSGEIENDVEPARNQAEKFLIADILVETTVFYY